MAIETEYNYVTFRYYLELDVLQEVAKLMEWTDITAEYDEDDSNSLFFHIQGTKSANSNVLVLTEPLPVDLPAGTLIFRNTSGGTSNYLSLSIKANKDATKILVNEAYADSVSIDTNILKPTIQTRDAQPIYDAITNEALFTLGYDKPEDVPANELRKFKLLGRIEAWRAVVYNTLTDVDISTNDTQLYRSQVNTNALNQLEFAETELDRFFPSNLGNNVVQPTTRTYAGGITVRW